MFENLALFFLRLQRGMTQADAEFGRACVRAYGRTDARTHARTHTRQPAKPAKPAEPAKPTPACLPG